MRRGWYGDRQARTRRALTSWVLVALLAAGCGDDRSVTPDASPSPDGGPDQYQPERIGLINLIGGSDGEVQAQLLDRPEPLAPELRDREGVCALYVRRVLDACAPLCDDSSVCVEPGECAAKAQPVTAGDITVTGLRQRLVFRSLDGGYSPESSPPEELFDSGARIRVSAPGGELPGFTAELAGVPRLQVGFSEIRLRRGKATRLTWTAAGVGRVAALLTGGRPGSQVSSMMLCETDDFGDLSIPAALAARLPGADAGEVERAAVMRLSRALVSSSAGVIEIVAGQKVAVELVRE
jgi:hypothetical protein